MYIYWLVPTVECQTGRPAVPVAIKTAPSLQPYAISGFVVGSLSVFTSAIVYYDYVPNLERQRLMRVRSDKRLHLSQSRALRSSEGKNLSPPSLFGALKINPLSSTPFNERVNAQGILATWNFALFIPRKGLSKQRLSFCYFKKAQLSLITNTWMHLSTHCFKCILFC